MKYGENHGVSNMKTHSKTSRTSELKKILAAAALAALCQTVLAADVVNIADYGEDGGTHFYQVACSDGRKGSVEDKTEPREICVRSRDAEPICRANWTVKKAALEICR